ncbi:MAG: PqqD family protein [Bdellovibrionota bacterium]
MKTSDLLEKTFKHNPSVVTRKVAGETILVPISRKISEQACLYTLNEEAAFIWDRFDGQQTGRQLIDSIISEYKINPVQAESDVKEFIDELISIEALHSDGL